MTTARDIMSSKIISIESDASPVEIAKIMYKNKISSVIMIKDQIPIGIVTERDLATKIVAQDKKPSEVVTSDIITSSLVTVSASTSVDEVVKKMTDKKIRRVLVMDGDQPLGIITVTDFVKHLHSMLVNIENYKQDLYQELIEDWEDWML